MTFFLKRLARSDQANPDFTPLGNRSADSRDSSTTSRMNFPPNAVAAIFADSTSSECKPVIAYQPKQKELIHQLGYQPWRVSRALRADPAILLCLARRKSIEWQACPAFSPSVQSKPSGLGRKNP
jgi:hypothetical protein